MPTVYINGHTRVEVPEFATPAQVNEALRLADVKGICAVDPNDPNQRTEDEARERAKERAREKDEESKPRSARRFDEAHAWLAEHAPADMRPLILDALDEKRSRVLNPRDWDF